MPRFPASERLSLPCRLDQYLEGKLHTDGRRYLPLLLFHLLTPDGGSSALEGFTLLGVVDRHHIVDPALTGQDGVARLVFLLSQIDKQEPPYRQGLVAEAGLPEGRASTAPLAYGHVIDVPTWEIQQEQLSFVTFSLELLLDIGIGIIGVRTSVTAERSEERWSAAQIAPGDWLRIERSRIDILAFDT